MGTLISGIRDIIFPSVESRGRTRRGFSIRYGLLLVIIPIVAAVSSAITGVVLTHPEVVAASVGVLGGLLIAHAIFVFQLRVSLKPKGHPDAVKNDRVYQLVDQMFDGVLWSSAVALALTLGSGAIAAVLPEEATVNRWVTAVFVLVAAHLVGCLAHVISATTTAYQTLKDDNL